MLVGKRDVVQALGELERSGLLMVLPARLVVVHREDSTASLRWRRRNSLDEVCIINSAVVHEHKYKERER